MVKSIKMYFLMRKMERQMKYELLSKVYLILSEKGKYVDAFTKIVDGAAKMDSNELLDKFINSMAELAHNMGQEPPRSRTNDD